MSTARRFHAQLSALPATLRGALWMLLAAMGFGCVSAIIRYLSASLPPLEIVFLRNAAGLMFMLPWLARSGLGALRTDKFRLYFWRSAVGLFGLTTWVFALAMMPLADAVALGFTAPLFATMLAALLLGEVVRMRRWTATIVGFLGALIILRPGVADLQWAQLVILASSASAGLSVVLVKQLTKTEPANAIVTYQTLYLIPLSLIPALFVWKTPPAELWPLILLLGAGATAGQFAMTRAFAATDASAVMPFDYARLPFVAFLGYAVFGEQPDLWTWIGAAVIAAAGIYVAQREAYLARLAGHRPAPVAAAKDEVGA